MYALGIWCVLCVCCALCAVCGSSWGSQCHASRSPTPALPSYHPETPSTGAYTAHFLSFSSLFLYPGADYTVPPALPLYNVYGNPDLSVRLCCELFPVFCVPTAVFSPCAVCSVCLLCVPHALGIWCGLCVFAVRCVLCLGPALHHSVTLSRTCSAFNSHTQKLSPRMRIYDIIPSPFRPFSCTPVLIIQYPSHLPFATFMGNPTCKIENLIQRPCCFLCMLLPATTAACTAFAGALLSRNMSLLSLDCSTLWRRLATACTSATIFISTACLASIIWAYWYTRPPCVGNSRKSRICAQRPPLLLYSLIAQGRLSVKEVGTAASTRSSTG